MASSIRDEFLENKLFINSLFSKKFYNLKLKAF